MCVRVCALVERKTEVREALRGGRPHSETIRGLEGFTVLTHAHWI